MTLEESTKILNEKMVGSFIKLLADSFASDYLELVQERVRYIQELELAELKLNNIIESCKNEGLSDKVPIFDTYRENCKIAKDKIDRKGKEIKLLIIMKNQILKEFMNNDL